MKTMRTRSKIMSLFLSLAFVFMALPNNALALPNPSENVLNGDIWSWQESNRIRSEPDFNVALGPAEVLISQQIIADNGDGTFDVELKVKGAADIRAVSDEAIVFLLDESGSMTGSAWTSMRNACIDMVNNYPTTGNTKFGIVAFSTTARTILHLTENRTQVLDALRSMTYSGGNTNLIAGMNLAKLMLDGYIDDGNEGIRSIILITDGVPNAGGTISQAINTVNSAKQEGIFIYVAGFGASASANGALFMNIASSVDMCRIAASYTQLQQILNDPMIGLNVQQNSKRNDVTVSMGEYFEFIDVLSNSNNGDWFLTGGVTGTLYWQARDASGSYTTGSTLVYRVRIHESAMNLGFQPVSRTAIFRFTHVDSHGEIFQAHFDIPKARIEEVEEIAYYLNYYAFSVDDFNLLGSHRVVIPALDLNVSADIDPNLHWQAGWKPGEILSSTVITTNGQEIDILYDPIEFTVTFDSDGGSPVADQTVPYINTGTAKPADPTKNGFVFAEWYLGDTLYDFTATVTSDIELTAHWTPIRHTVSFNSAGGTMVALSSQSVEDGHTAIRPDDPVRERFVFQGWYLGDALYDFATPVNADIELTARWSPVRFTVTFNSAGGSAVASQSVEDGLTATKPADPTRAGYTFAGWYLGSAPFNFSTPVTEDILLIAHWTPVATMPKTGDNLLLPLSGALCLLGAIALLGSRSSRRRKADHS